MVCLLLSHPYMRHAMQLTTFSITSQCYYSYLSLFISPSLFRPQALSPHSQFPTSLLDLSIGITPLASLPTTLGTQMLAKFAGRRSLQLGRDDLPAHAVTEQVLQRYVYAGALRSLMPGTQTSFFSGTNLSS